MYFLHVITPIKSILNLFLIYRVIVKKSPNKTKIDESFICIFIFFYNEKNDIYVLFSMQFSFSSQPISGLSIFQRLP